MSEQMPAARLADQVLVRTRFALGFLVMIPICIFAPRRFLRAALGVLANRIAWARRYEP